MIVAFYYSWRLTFAVLSTCVPSVIILYFVNRLIDPAIRAQKHELAHASKHAVAALVAIDLVKVYNGEVHELWQYQQTIRRAAKHYFRQAICNCVQLGYIKLWMNSIFVVGFYYAVVLVGHGQLTPGHALTTFYAAITAFQALESVGPHWMTLAKGLAAGQSLAALVEDVASSLHADPVGHGQAQAGYRPLHCDGGVELKKVSFAYPSNPTRPVVCPSSMFFAAGKVTYLVGRSGSGKSTIGNLLVRFYEPSSGRIRLNGIPLEQLDLTWLRSNVTLVQQTSILFNDSLANNVALGARDVSTVDKSDLEMACGLALLQSTIAGLPQGLDTDVGPGAYNLSGGQKQRVAIARSRLRDPPVLILDEITSGLDPANRGLIMDAIRRWRHGKTTIIITHEVSQIEDNEYVYVMDGGRLVQEGYRKGLATAEGGLFASLLAAADRDGKGSDADTEADYGVTDGEQEDFELAEARMIGVALASPKAARVYESRFSKYSQGISDVESQTIPVYDRMSLGNATQMATRMRTKNLWNKPLTPLVSLHEEDPSFPPAGYFRPESENYELDEVDSNYASWAGSRASYELLRSSSQAARDSRLSMSTTPRERQVSFHAQSRTETSRPDEGLRRQDSMRVFIEEKLAKTKKGKANNIVKGQEQQPNTPPLSAVLKSVWPALNKTTRVQFILGLCLCPVVAGCQPAFSLLFAQLLGSFWTKGDAPKEGSRWGIYLVIVAVVEGVSTFLAFLLFERVGQAWVNHLRKEAFSRILSQPKSWFDKPNHSPSRISECLDWSAEEMRKLVAQFVPIMVILVIMASSSIFWAMAIRWDLALVALSGLPMAVGGARMNSKVSDKWESACIAAAEKTSSVFAEAFCNIRVVRAWTLERHFARKHDKSAEEEYSLAKKRAAHAGFYYGLYQSIPFFITALTFYYGTRLLRDGRINVTQELRVFNLILFSLGNSITLLGNIPQLAAAKTTALQMLYYAHLPRDAGHEHQGTEKIRTPLPVRMTNLRFIYPDQSTPVLHKLTLQITAGSCTAIVGSSGCGKSTIASLLLRLYEPDAQTPGGVPVSATSTFRHLHPHSHRPQYPLTYNSHPASRLSTPSLRNKIAYVPQQPFLFPGSIRQNIVYGLAESSPHQFHFRRAAVQAGIHDFICSLPEGYNTIVGSDAGGGMSLSGGQMQRIAIARALVRNPQLLVLDEPTSSLDAEAAEGIRQVVLGLVKSGRRTGEKGAMAVVVVTHSKEMMKVADEIVVVEGGRVVETGSYEELRTAGGSFTRLVGLGERPDVGRTREKGKGKERSGTRRRENAGTEEDRDDDTAQSPRWLRDSWQMNQEALRRLEGGR
jgi:ATP-binding cassette subfamily B (MDR/TAP) protein 1